MFPTSRCRAPFLAAMLGPSLLFAQPAQRPADPPSYRPRPHERIALVGNSLAERMSLFGNFETRLHLRFSDLGLVVRNFGWPADEVGVRQRPDHYTRLDDPLAVFGPDTFLCFFGFNESFAGQAGVRSFEQAYERFLADYGRRYARADGRPPRFVLVSPIAFEHDRGPDLPDGREHDRRLALYTEAVRRVAARNGLVFVDLFHPTRARFAETGGPYTVDGAHLNEAGDRLVGAILDRALFGPAPAVFEDAERFEQVRAAVVDKAWVHQQDYRMLNGWYVYGTRRTYDKETFPREYRKIRAMVAVRDRYVHALARGHPVPERPDDRGTGELIVPKTLFGARRYSEPEELRYPTPEESIAAMRVPEGFAVELFASEREFPELANPVQIAFDDRGRLWVACMPTYPMWRPGDPKPRDRLLVFEDEDGDGRADRCKVFYDRLHCPTGFEFWNGGVLVLDQPRLVFLRDTDGDDRADEVTRLMDGFASDDTHHAAGAWEFSHGGLLYMLEGVHMSATLETPWGPLRSKGPAGCYVLDPRSLRVRRFTTPGYGNPWCCVFDAWGQCIVGDGTNARQHWATPLSGAQRGPRHTLEPVFDNQGMRPAVGNELLYSRNFPAAMQGHLVYGCVINMNGFPRFTVRDDGAGFTGERVEDLLRSSDKSFRPVDPKIGPDGALWFGDWCNALIGHMQYSQRDPNRDHTHGRIYRLVNRARPLVEPVSQHGKSLEALLDQLRAPELRTRYRARRALRAAPREKVLAATRAWLAARDPEEPEHDRLLCEAMWTLQSFHAVDRELIERVLRAERGEARAAAVHVLCEERERVARPLDLLERAVRDPHPRVRLEAVRAASFFPVVRAARLALVATEYPMDRWLDYTLVHTLNALEGVWRPVHERGELVAADGPAARFLADWKALRGRGGAAVLPLRVLRNEKASRAERDRAMSRLARVRGRASNGAKVFERVCIACHVIDGKGIDFGPDLSDVGTRLGRREILESILEPNAKIAPGYAMVNVTTRDGATFSGFLEAEDAAGVTLKLAGGVRRRLAKTEIAAREEVLASNMPDGLGFTMAPSELVDLVEYLAGRGKPGPGRKGGGKAHRR